MTLSDLVRQSIFEDAQNTTNNPCLIGPPTVEFAPYNRTPGGRRRVDARAGTIDQDSEFMAFLEGLANPTTVKESNSDTGGDGASGKLEKVTTTPLVQFLKDKKANKSKEAAVKAAKKQEAQLAKGKAGKDTAASSEDAKKKGKDTKGDRAVERAAKEAVRILNREASAKGAEPLAKKAEEAASTPPTHPKLDLGRVPGRQRGSVIAAHIRMLQRDLGLSPAQAHRQVRRDTADAQKAEKAATSAKLTLETKDVPPPSVQSPVVPTAPKAIAPQATNRRSRAKPTDDNKGSSSTPTPSTPSTPITLLKKPDVPPTSPVPAMQPLKSTPVPNSARRVQSSSGPLEGATQAFIKHANPSQGVTEPLLKEAMEKFGPVSMVEIDRRKGFAYVDFQDAPSLRKAMAANPITVAQGTVQVMQRKGTSLPPEKKPPHHQLQQPQQSPSARGGRGGRGGTVGRRGGRGGIGARGGGGGGGGVNASQAPTSAPTGPAGK
jgi:regulator of nonsense transcripts 3